MLTQTYSAKLVTKTDLPLRSRRLGLGRLRDGGVVITLLVLFGVLSFTSPVFFTARNLLNILDQWSGVGIIACALTILLIAGEFDLSAGIVFALSGVVAAQVALVAGAVPGLIVGCLVGLIVGMVNGLIVNVLRVNSFITTLGVSIIATGVALVITNGLVINVRTAAFAAVGNGAFLGVKWTIWIFLVVVLASALLLHFTTFGRYVYGVGGNRDAVRLSGIRPGIVSFSAFALTGLCAGIAGVVSASSNSAGQGDVGGYPLLFNIFAVCVIGGTSITGGAGAIWRTVVGLFLLALIGNGFNLLAVNYVYQNIVTGVLILFAVIIDVWSRRERS